MAAVAEFGYLPDYAQEHVMRDLELADAFQVAVCNGVATRRRAAAAERMAGLGGVNVVADRLSGPPPVGAPGPGRASMANAPGVLDGAADDPSRVGPPLPPPSHTPHVGPATAVPVADVSQPDFLAPARWGLGPFPRTLAAAEAGWSSPSISSSPSADWPGRPWSSCRGHKGWWRPPAPPGLVSESLARRQRGAITPSRSSQQPAVV